MNIIHRPDFYLKHNVSETGFCLHLQVEDTQLGPEDRANLCDRATATTQMKTKLHGLSPRAKFTDRATAACRQHQWDL
jgi:hypothetical protein